MEDTECKMGWISSWIDKWGMAECTRSKWCKWWVNYNLEKRGNKENRTGLA